MLRNRTGQHEHSEKDEKEKIFPSKGNISESKESLIQTPEQTSDLVSSVLDGMGKSLWLMSNFLIVEC